MAFLYLGYIPLLPNPPLQGIRRMGRRPELKRVRGAWRVTSQGKVLCPGFRGAEGKEKGKGVVARRGLKEAQCATAGRPVCVRTRSRVNNSRRRDVMHPGLHPQGLGVGERSVQDADRGSRAAPRLIEGNRQAEEAGSSHLTVLPGPFVDVWCPRAKSVNEIRR